MARQRGHEDAPVRITTAATSAGEDLRRRQRNYLIAMAIRSVCFISAGVAGILGVTWLWPTLIVGAIVLPYLAVVLANVQAPRQDGFELPDTAYGAPQLESGRGREL